MQTRIAQFCPMVQIAPSVLGADFARLGEEITSAEQAGVQMFHLDVMDGHFVPNISFGPAIVRTIEKLTDRFLDVHLMLSQPEKYFEPFALAGADNITFHLEVHPDPIAMAEKVKNLGVKAGISINPDMPIERVLPYLSHFDFLLIMSVFPGFGGQAFMTSALPKIATARKFIDANRLGTLIEVDGGVDGSTALEVVRHGADILVMGTAFFRQQNRKQFVESILHRVQS